MTVTSLYYLLNLYGELMWQKVGTLVVIVMGFRFHLVHL